MTIPKLIFPMLLVLGATSLAVAAERPSISLPQVTYAPNEDTFYQDQYRVLYGKTDLSLKSAVNTVVNSELFSKGLGLPSDYRFQFPILVDIKVIPEDSLYHGLQGTAGWKQVEGKWLHVLTLNIEAFIQNPKEDINRLLAHEMAHIILADIVGAQEYDPIPRWLNEGLAQSVTDEGRTRVSDFAKQLKWSGSPWIPCELEGPVDTFAFGEGNYKCYPEYYLAVERLSQVAGPAAIGKIIQSLKQGHKISDAYQSVTNKDYANFQQDVDSFAADVIADRKPIP